MSRKLKEINQCRKLYHLSDTNHDGRTFYPRIPDSRLDDEDDKHKRVCFSRTMSGCVKALYNHYYGYVDLYVHIPTNIDDVINHNGLYKPSNKLVPDVLSTKEIWCTKPVKLKCIGFARFCMIDNDFNNKVKIKWLKKYN